MHHIMFDIDGTLIESYQLDSRCYVAAVEKVTGIKINSDWASYRHVTDSGILDEFMHQHDIKEVETTKAEVKRAFIDQLKEAIKHTPIKPIAGASELLAHLICREDILVSLATGGWYDSAILKLESAGIDATNIAIASADDHMQRIEIMKTAEARLAKQVTGSRFYFGDGIWDQTACKELGINFILVGKRFFHNPAIDHYQPITKILPLIGLAPDL